MSCAGNPQPSAPLTAAWSIDQPETVLWRGAGRVTGQRAERETELVVTWRPELDVRFRQEADDAEDLALFCDEERGEVRLRLRELGIDTSATPDGTASGGRLTEVTWGHERRVRRVRFHLTNFPDVLLPGVLGNPNGARWRGTIAVEGGPWTLRLDRRRETKEIIEHLTAQGTYAVTHIGELSRTDRGAFGAGELQEALTCIHFLFSFARAAWVAPMLPVGFDQDGVPVWWQASARWCTAGLGRGLTWLDRLDGAGLEEVVHLWLELWQHLLWRQVLPRVVIYYLEANRQGRDDPSFLESKHAMAQAALELLAWAILKEDPITAAGSERWHQGQGAAAKNVRGLLNWAGIPSTVPAELPALARELQANKEWQDAADLVPWLRNQVVHPRLRDGCFGPKQEVVLAGWLLVCWYAELVLLRRLGYTGGISNRLEPDHWVGQTVPVPWADG
ncbi:MAG: hypothetical protein ACRDS0_20840 [Pseudonocardiaceae bacterium]